MMRTQRSSRGDPTRQQACDSINHLATQRAPIAVKPTTSATLTGLSLLAQGSTKVAFGWSDCAHARVVEFAAAQFELASPSSLATLTGFEPVLPP